MRQRVRVITVVFRRNGPGISKLCLLVAMCCSESRFWRCEKQLRHRDIFSTPNAPLFYNRDTVTAAQVDIRRLQQHLHAGRRTTVTRLRNPQITIPALSQHLITTTQEHPRSTSPSSFNPAIFTHRDRSSSSLDVLAPRVLAGIAMHACIGEMATHRLYSYHRSAPLLQPVQRACIAASPVKCHS
ncbi:hypothetical protein BKA63DRAFT_91852 [Paraphoma chrysanthemicola]|nr:hypothetical protein BKA63DRAFT_91852 [Paraphoma chrysanthemicola]